MQTRRELWLTVAAAILGGCQRPQAGKEPPLPNNVGQDWQLQSEEGILTAQLPHQIRTMGVQNAWRGVYAGPGNFMVDYYMMGTPSNAFEAMQNWRPEEGKMAFHHERGFIVVESHDASREEMQQFVRQLQQSLQERGAERN
jgi:hypothetical protein